MILSMMEFEGNADELMSRMRETIEPVAARLAPEFGGISSTVVRTDRGIMVVNLWRDDEGRHRLPEHPEMREALERAGVRPNARAYEVLAHRVAQQPTAT